MSEEDRCRELRPLIGGLACDALERRDQALAERHLDGCPVCAAELRQLREVVGLLHGALADTGAPESPPVPARVREGLRDRLAAGRAGKPEPRGRGRGRRIAGGAGALLGAAAASLVAVVLLTGGSSADAPVGGYDLNPTAAAPRATGYAWVSPSEAGTDLRLRAEGLGPTSGDQRYRLLVASREGTVDAGSFLVPESGEISGVRLTAAAPLEKITSMRVVRDGRPAGQARVVLRGTPAESVPPYP